ncbi:hypothetical protein J3R30DRAFT_1820973 [Lentinula aciculospora]|uniref:Hemerythrin-like domain-containing protein n=1 Tax=Lentinula aciculospora TaxID=153920 RepID=A0A9W9DS77_9AGAR|nr:hypothetical protein J3R30DRAFT_1820973 [Lentinula aciculospora]
MFPQTELFPIDVDGLQTSSAIAHLLTVNKLMKNTLLRALNRITELCPVMNESHGGFGSFVDYVATFTEMTCLHLQGDERFFVRPNAQGKKLVDFLGTACNPNVERLQSKLKNVREKAKEWGKAPTCYRHEDILSILCFSSELVEVMRKQLDCIQNGEIGTEIDDEILRDMIQENIRWMSGTSDIAVLLPFILSHHDSSSCPNWPTISPEGWAELPRIVDVYADLWKIAPFHPITKKSQTLI